MNLTPLRNWYRDHAPEVQLNTTRWEGGLSKHTLEDLTLAVEELDRVLPADGSVLPTPALVNELLREVQQARRDVEDKVASLKGYEAYGAKRGDKFRRWAPPEDAA